MSSTGEVARERRPTQAWRLWRTREALCATAFLFAAGLGVTVWPEPLSAWPLAVAGELIVIVVVVGGATVLLLSQSRFRVSERTANTILGLTVLALVAWYVTMESFYGPGSDSAEALELGARQLLHHDNPWVEQTRFGNPLSPMFGAYILAAPFVALTGSVYLLPIACLVLLALILRRGLGSHVAAAVMLMFGASRHTLLWLPNQADNWIAAALVLMAAWWGYSALRRDARWAALLSAIAFGVALSNRFILGAVVLPLAVFLLRRFGPRRALPWLALAGSVTTALCFGPLLVDAHSYLAGPLAAGFGKVSTGVPQVTPLVVAIATLSVLVWGSVRVKTWGDVWLTAALSLAAMIATLVAMRLPTDGFAAIASYETIAYNGMWLLFGLVGLTSGSYVAESRRRRWAAAPAE